MTTAMLEATDIGPVERVTIAVPEGGGLVVFRGANGSGKSTMLGAIDAALTGRGKPAIRDGALRGEFRGFGVEMTIGKSRTVRGEAEVHSLEGRLSVADLVDPGIKDPAAADAHRIKALVQLVGEKAKPSLFHGLCASPAEFEKAVSPAALTHDDVLKMAAAVKRDFEANSRKTAESATMLRNRAAVARQSNQGVDLDAECDADKLQHELEAAIHRRSTLEAENEAADRSLRAATEARAALERAATAYTGPTVAVANDELLDADHERTIAALGLEEAEKKLAAAKERFRSAEAVCTRREATLLEAKRHDDMTAAWRKQIEDAKGAAPPRPADLVAAAEAVGAARKAIEQGAIVRRARAAIAEAKQYEADAVQRDRDATRMREAARGVDDVLSGIVARSGVPLRIEPVNAELRLTVQTKRGKTCFAELSDGERWRIALDIAIKAVGKGGELTLPQHSWEGLDPANRRAVALQAREGGVIIFTAEAADGPLRAEEFAA